MGKRREHGEEESELGSGDWVEGAVGRGQRGVWSGRRGMASEWREGCSPLARGREEER